MCALSNDVICAGASSGAAGSTASSQEQQQQQQQVQQDQLHWEQLYRGLDTSCDIKGLDPNSCYAVKVKAQNAMGSSRWSELEYFTTGPAAPSAPVGLAAAGEVQPGLPDCHVTLLVHVMSSNVQQNAQLSQCNAGSSSKLAPRLRCSLSMLHLKPSGQWILTMQETL